MGYKNMLFNDTLEIVDIHKDQMKIIHRDALRAIIFKDNKLLMIHTNKGDYKFPGGGANPHESYKETIKREVQEETGYLVHHIKHLVGMMTERKKDDHEDNTIFEMVSCYYLCEIGDLKTEQHLDDYELELDFQPVWVNLDEVIQFNEKIIDRKDKDMNPWVLRETHVLKKLKTYQHDII